MYRLKATTSAFYEFFSTPCPLFSALAIIPSASF